MKPASICSLLLSLMLAVGCQRIDVPPGPVDPIDNGALSNLTTEQAKLAYAAPRAYSLQLAAIALELADIQDGASPLTDRQMKDWLGKRTGKAYADAWADMATSDSTAFKTKYDPKLHAKRLREQAKGYAKAGGK